MEMKSKARVSLFLSLWLFLSLMALSVSLCLFLSHTLSLGLALSLSLSFLHSFFLSQYFVRMGPQPSLSRDGGECSLPPIDDAMERKCKQTTPSFPLMQAFLFLCWSRFCRILMNIHLLRADFGYGDLCPLVIDCPSWYSLVSKQGRISFLEVSCCWSQTEVLSRPISQILIKT